MFVKDGSGERVTLIPEITLFHINRPCKIVMININSFEHFTLKGFFSVYYYFVLCSVGIGNSGGDIAVELSRHASRVYLSTRRGAWVLSRLGKGGEPFDQQASRRFSSLIPLSLRLHLFTKLVNQRFDHEVFALRPQHPIIGQHPMVNDDLPHRIIVGSVVIKPNVTNFTKTGVVFDDGTQVNDLDAVIFCTGYKIGFKFIDQSILSVSYNKVELYKYVFSPNLAKPTLAVFGCVQPLGAIFPLSELQARWAVRVFGGKSSLPAKSVMMEDIEKKRKAMQERYYTSKRHTIQVRQENCSANINNNNNNNNNNINNHNNNNNNHNNIKINININKSNKDDDTMTSMMMMLMMMMMMMISACFIISAHPQSKV